MIRWRALSQKILDPSSTCQQAINRATINFRAPPIPAPGPLGPVDWRKWRGVVGGCLGRCGSPGAGRDGAGAAVVPLITGRPGQCGAPAPTAGMFVESVLWIVRMGAPGATWRRRSATGTERLSSLRPLEPDARLAVHFRGDGRSGSSSLLAPTAPIDFAGRSPSGTLSVAVTPDNPVSRPNPPVRDGTTTPRATGSSAASANPDTSAAAQPASTRAHETPGRRYDRGWRPLPPR